MPLRAINSHLCCPPPPYGLTPRGFLSPAFYSLLFPLQSMPQGGVIGSGVYPSFPLRTWLRREAWLAGAQSQWQAQSFSPLSLCSNIYNSHIWNYIVSDKVTWNLSLFPLKNSNAPGGLAAWSHQLNWGNVLQNRCFSLVILRDAATIATTIIISYQLQHNKTFYLFFVQATTPTTTNHRVCWRTY